MPSGTVTFRDGSTVLGTGTLVNGVASFSTSSLALGSHSITASYGGDVNDLTSASSSVAVMISAPATGPVNSGQTSKNNFWNHADGIALMLSFNGSFTSTAMGDWMAATFPNLFGANSQVFNLKGASNLQVTVDYQFGSILASKTYMDMFELAVDMYATSSALGGGAASAAAGFTVSSAGLAGGTWNVGSAGSAFGVANNSTQTVFDLLMDANNRSPNGQLFMGNNAQTKAADGVFNDILKSGK